MYVRVQRRPTTLGDASIPWWAWVLDPLTTYGVYKAYGSPPASSPTKLITDALPIIPGSSFTDVVQNAWTGKPTDAQISKNAQDCMSAIQAMRTVKGSNIPAGAEQKCLTDQQAYVKLIGGTADTNITHTAAWVLLGLLGIGSLYVISR